MHWPSKVNNSQELAAKCHSAESLLLVGRSRNRICANRLTGQVLSGFIVCFGILLAGVSPACYSAGVAGLPEIGQTHTQAHNHGVPVVVPATKMALGDLPRIEYSTFVGGADDDVAYAVALDPERNAYIVGGTSTPQIGTLAEGANKGGVDALLVKLNADGKTAAYSKQIGGRNWDTAYAVAVDREGSVFVAGTTLSEDFPTVAAHQKTLRGSRNAFVMKFSRHGEIVYATFLGGSSTDVARAVVSDGRGGVYVAGETSSSDFPGVGVRQVAFGGGSMDGFVAHLNEVGRLTSASYVGGNGDDKVSALALGHDGVVYVAGSTTSRGLRFYKNLGGANLDGTKAFVARLSPETLAVEYMAVLGGSGNDLGLALTINTKGMLYLAGSTTSPDFPLVSPMQSVLGGMTDGFIAKISPDGRHLLSSTYIGGEEIDYVYAAALDAMDNLYVTGETRSPDFPLKHNIRPMRPICTCGASAFVTKIGPKLDKIIYSTTVSGSGWDYGYGIAADNTGRAYVVGNTNAHDFPTTSGSAEEFMMGVADAFLFRIGTLQATMSKSKNILNSR